jgi:signal transduction histidine kinase
LNGQPGWNQVYRPVAVADLSTFNATMKPEEINRFSKIFSDPNPLVVARKINHLSQPEKVSFARACFELTGKVLGALLDPSINQTFQKIFQSIGRMFFTRFPTIDRKLKKDPTRWRKTIDELRVVPLFQQTSDFDLLSIAEHVETRQLKANEPFLAQYQEVEGVYLVTDPVKVFEHNSKIATVTRNGIFGDDPCITGEKESSITAKPTKDCQAFFVNRDRFVNLIRSIPGLQEKIFQDVVERARQGSVRAEEQRRLLQEILDNIGQGSFSIDMAGEIGENYTAIAAKYLGVDNLAGVPFADLAFRKDRKMLRNYYRALHMLFSGNQFDASMVLDLLPKEITIHERIFKLHYTFLQDGSGNVMSVFVRMEDLTLERELAKKEQEEKGILDKMQQNIGGFMDMLKDVENSFDLMNRFADDFWDKEIQPDSQTLGEIMRTLHGSKGLAGQFELNRLKEVIHALEDWFLEIDREGLAGRGDPFLMLFQKLEQELQYARSFKENLGEGIIRILDGVSFTREEFAALTAAVTEKDYSQALTLIRSRETVSAVRIINNWKKDTERLADRLGKQVAFVSDIDEQLVVPREMAKKLNVNLGHLYRNCVDHGIEPPAQRLEKGKEETGRLTVVIRRQKDQLVMTIADDGAGLNTDRIVDIARNNPGLDQGLVESYITRGEYWRILFLAGFSAATTVTDVSGRGVGMDAVLKTVQSFGGEISMESVPGRGSTFHIQIPLGAA